MPPVREIGEKHYCSKGCQGYPAIRNNQQNTILMVWRPAFQLKWKKVWITENQWFLVPFWKFLLLIQFWVKSWPPKCQDCVLWIILDLLRPLIPLGVSLQCLKKKFALSGTVIRQTSSGSSRDMTFILHGNISILNILHYKKSHMYSKEKIISLKPFERERFVLHFQNYLSSSINLITNIVTNF